MPFNVEGCVAVAVVVDAKPSPVLASLVVSTGGAFGVDVIDDDSVVPAMLRTLEAKAEFDPDSALMRVLLSSKRTMMDGKPAEDVTGLSAVRK